MVKTACVLSFLMIDLFPFSSDKRLFVCPTLFSVTSAELCPEERAARNLPARWDHQLEFLQCVGYSHYFLGGRYFALQKMPTKSYIIPKTNDHYSVIKTLPDQPLVNADNNLLPSYSPENWSKKRSGIPTKFPEYQKCTSISPGLLRLVIKRTVRVWRDVISVYMVLPPKSRYED